MASGTYIALLIDVQNVCRFHLIIIVIATLTLRLYVIIRMKKHIQG